MNCGDIMIRLPPKWLMTAIVVVAILMLVADKKHLPGARPAISRQVPRRRSVKEMSQRVAAVIVVTVILVILAAMILRSRLCRSDLEGRDTARIVTKWSPSGSLKWKLSSACLPPLVPNSSINLSTTTSTWLLITIKYPPPSIKRKT